jgi:dipeptidyl aminopeptidase/acylaminoacyl peptidase
MGAVWAPDGAWFANFVGEKSLTLRNLQGEVKNIFRADKGHLLSHPIWSPDSKRIALISIIPGKIAAENVASVIVIDITEEKVLLKNSVPVWVVLSKFRWSPNGRKILLINGNQLVGGAVVIDTEAGSTEILTDKFIIAEWAPDSDSVYYFEINVNQSYQKELEGFYLKKLGGSKPVKLADKKKVESLGLKTWLQIKLSPGNAKLLVAGGILTQDGPKNEVKDFIYIYDVSNGKTVILDKSYKKYQTEDLITSLEWSPDENSLAAFTLDVSEMIAAKIKILNLLKGTWKTVATPDTSKVPAMNLIDMLYLGKTLSWTQ